MNVLVRHLFFLGLIWEFGLGFVTRIVYAQDIDLPTLAAGMKYYDSLIRSGTGTCIYESSPAQEERLVTVFTFEGRKMRADILEGLEAGNLKFFNGELQITFTPRMNRYTKQDRSTIDPMIDPRYWMRGAELFYLEKSLGEHLEQRPSRILRQETLDGMLCYIVDVSNPPDHVRYLWIAPEMGFRLLKIYDESWVDSRRINFNYRLFYTEYKTNGKIFWFPKLVKYEAINLASSKKIEPTMLKKKYVFKNTFRVQDFKVNVPVSAALELKISPGTLIHDSSSNTYIPVEKILK